MTNGTVLHVAFPSHGGVGRVVADLAGAQVASGWNVAVASPKGPLTTWLHPRAAHHDWDATRSPGLTLRDEVRRLRRILTVVEPDVVHLHSSKAGLAGRLALRRSRPTVFQPHAWSFLAAAGPLATAARLWEQTAARWADVIIHVSAAERQIGEAAGIAPRRWALVANGVDLQHFQPSDRAQARQRLGLADAPLVVCAGRICRQKGQDLLVSIWPTVRAEVPTATLSLVGRAEEALPDLPAGVIVRPETDDPRDWYAAADLLVAPSRWEAGLPLVAREAMACGCSVLLADLDVVRDDFPADAGALVPVDDAMAWTEALLSRLLNPAQARAEGGFGHRHAQSHFDIAMTSSAVDAVYRSLLDGRTA